MAYFGNICFILLAVEAFLVNFLLNIDHLLFFTFCDLIRF